MLRRIKTLADHHAFYPLDSRSSYLIIPKAEAQHELQPEFTVVIYLVQLFNETRGRRTDNQKERNHFPLWKQSIRNYYHPNINFIRYGNIVQRETNGNRGTRDRLWWMIKTYLKFDLLVKAYLILKSLSYGKKCRNMLKKCGGQQPNKSFFLSVHLC